MSNFTTYRSNEDELTSPSSDEKMDTGSESFRSQDTPNSILSDFDDEQNVLRLQNPSTITETSLSNSTDGISSEGSNNEEKHIKDALKSQVLRLNPEQNDSLTKNMARLNIDSPKTLGLSPPKFSSTLTLTTNHPLMGMGSPDDFPDLIPKKIIKEDDKDLSLSSIEDERHDTNGFYSPQRNTSKNNLYISENFVTADSTMLNDSELAPDVARINIQRRTIKPKLDERTPQRTLARLDVNDHMKMGAQSTPYKDASKPIDVTKEEYHSGVADWCESPSELRNMPNFDLPIEMSSAMGMHNDLDSPDVVSSSTQEEKSAYQALLDPYTGSVALKHTVPRVSNQRRKILLPPEEDRNSLDSASSMESEEEPPEPGPQPELGRAEPPADTTDLSDDDTDKRSKSTNTISYTSEPIPEYSLNEERSNERGWVDVPRGGHNHACDVKVIEPYKRVVSHGGYSRAGAALIVFSACHLPDNRRGDYTYVMDNLFLYVIWTLERLVTDEYVLVYLHGSAGRRKLPAFHWLQECYKLIDRRLRKSLKHLYLVHPTFWLKSFVLITKPFVSSKFFKKLSYVKSLQELMEQVPVDPNAIPDIVKQYDATKNR